MPTLGFLSRVGEANGYEYEWGRLMAKGIIFDIKEYALYDGPGVRETVFLKGCPLRCVWCHNPEGLSPKPELAVAGASCTNCGKCQVVCEHDICTLCGKCVDVCPFSLRKICGEVIMAEDLAKRLLSHADYYRALSGGVTFSGGEPLLQYDFLFDVLSRLKGVHRAVETSAFCEDAVFERLLSNCELVIMDIKLMDPDLHKAYTGVDNRGILKHYEVMVERGFPHIIRLPLIPGVNDTADNAHALASLLKNDASLIRLEILPYHKTAGAKYPNVGRIYEPSFDVHRAPVIHRNIFEDEGIRYTVL